MKQRCYFIVVNDNQIFCIGILIGLKSVTLFNLVGADIPGEDSKFAIKKSEWKGKGKL